ncbi:family 78 glycoside hydrolase catalytic domain [Aporhodopirellula aestuarii]|uniref:alpha-L-rhamnosidase n=1 Tax=Aporhodopirellula aestuarii TaxID=2950107 RepID=A0ABT0U0C1_9BACT|nr:family 78 glycoside hydrolase catalytic domain [Aporhodopirellula aestuarii]MCM2370290.1 glycoside hydrolase family 78 protein [Aporhodopirellula aestuarii]
MRVQSTLCLSVLCALLLLPLATTAVSSAQDRSSNAMGMTRLHCEYREQPLGIDHPKPRLGWELASDVRGAKQSAYRVLVASTAEDLENNQGDLWDSGKVISSQSVGVVYAGVTLASGQRCFWKVMVWDGDGTASEWSAPSFWEMGLLKESDWQAEWIGDGKPTPEKDEDFFKDDPAPLFRKPFKLSGRVKSSRLYISALGYYRASLNGQEVGDHQLDPLWTLPQKRVFYSVYDVTDQLSPDENCLGVELGNGWYNPLPLRLWGRRNLREHLPVGRPQFIAHLRIEYADGTIETIVSDDSWKFTQGPILRNNIYLGEKVDARKNIPGWNRPRLDDSGWAAAKIAVAPQGALTAQPSAAIKVTKKIRPVAISEPEDGVYIVDMGKNFGGWASIRFNVPAGTLIKIRYGELLNEDGTLNPMTSVCGQIKSLSGKPQVPGAPPTAWQEDNYIARGGDENYTPKFTFHAFRYIELIGLPSRPSLDSIEGLRMNSSVEPVGTFVCSNDLFNRIQEMCQWTFLSNLFGVQSDCPHRERFGYGGDLVTTSDAFILNYDMSGFYPKSTRDWADSTLPNGMLTDTAPSVGIQYCGVGWAMAHPHLQTLLYRYYGDRRIIEEQYAVSKRWFDLVRTQTPDHIVRSGLHDHETLQREKTPPMVTPLYCESARMLSKLASVLGKTDDAKEYARLADEIRAAYVSNFFDAETGVAGSGFQNSQSFALYLDMLPESDRCEALTHLLKEIEKHNGHLATGIFGTRYMLDVLSREGEVETVNAMVNKRDFPGWGHMIENGATTLWEHWEFSDNSLSHNHPMFGSVSQWFFNWLGGIEPAADAIGFDRIELHPRFVNGLDWVKCTHRSIHGPVVCDWKRVGDTVDLKLRVPVGSTAQLDLPEAICIIENDHPAAESTGVNQLPTQGGVKLQVESGSYQFEVQL